MDPNDDLARLRAQSDQAKEGLKEVAAVMWALFSSLEDQGFSEEQALTLTCTYMTNCQFNEDDE